ncbi:MAG: AraC family transcriptional regulator [Prevotellaceae bacterium]|nr:AraC family transcriptional regulator [Candidatus Minthosoma equi]
MVIQGDILTEKQMAGNEFFSSYQDKYIAMDNLDFANNPYIATQKNVYNSEYFFVVVVLRGTMHLSVRGIDIDVKENEHFIATPCTHLQTKESHCIYFSYLIRCHLMNDIYEQTGIGKKIPLRAFVSRHQKFTSENIEILRDIYLRAKEEHKKEDYQMKELVLRAFVTAFISRTYSFAKPEDEIPHMKNSKQHVAYSQFLTKLAEKHKEERSVQYYAKELRITPKYLSSITQMFTGLSASQVIDQYVIYAIKQTLYSNKNNIKTTSTEYNFPSQSFFGRYFKRITGFSPNEYIKQNNRRSLSFDQNNKEE